MMDDLHYKRLRMIKEVVRNPLFGEAMGEMKMELAIAAIDNPELNDRQAIYFTARALDVVIGKLNALANEAVHLEGQAISKGAA